jgi:hypothetical protein
MAHVSRGFRGNRVDLDDKSRLPPGQYLVKAFPHTLTRSQPPRWTGYARRVDAEMLAEVGPSPVELSPCRRRRATTE